MDSVANEFVGLDDAVCIGSQFVLILISSNNLWLDIFQSSFVFLVLLYSSLVCIVMFCSQGLLDFFMKQVEYFGTSDGIIFKYCVRLLKVLNKTEIFSRLFMCLEYTTNKENFYDTFLLTICGAVW
jgi:hypothetical protein